jgi:hypothetical protein
LKRFKQQYILKLLLTLALPLGGLGGLLSQNLVLNPSFEDTINCPIQPNGQYLYPPNNYLCQHWYCPTAVNILLYFNACAPHKPGANRSVPNNFPYLGWQNAKTGNAYCGIGTKILDTVGRIYIQTQLLTTLIQGHNYYLEFYTNKANACHYASNNIGAFFSALPISGTNTLIGYTPQINEQLILTDTVNWIKISASFIAQGGEEFLTIGNFFYDYQTQFLQTNNDSTLNGTGYYIDDVLLIDSTGLGIKEIQPNEFELYPNPASTLITIKTIEHLKLNTIKIYTILGELVSQKNSKQELVEIDISSFEEGLYFVQIQTENGVVVRKFMKQ